MHGKKLLICFLLIIILVFLPSNTDCGATYKGRLYLSSIGIDVALYYSNEQNVVDALDSAALFSLSYRPNTLIIADHNTQSFASMSDIQVDDEAYIEWNDGDITYLQCVEKIDGKNTGSGLTNLNGVNVVGPHPYITYTCKDYWRNIIICQWDVVPQPK